MSRTEAVVEERRKKSPLIVSPNPRPIGFVPARSVGTTAASAEAAHRAKEEARQYARTAATHERPAADRD